MAAVESFVTDTSPFHHIHHTMVGAGGSAESQYRRRSRSRAELTQSATSRPQTVAGTPPPSTTARAFPEQDQEAKGAVEAKPISPPVSSSLQRGEDYSKAAYSSQQNIPDASGPYNRESKQKPPEPTLRPSNGTLPSSPTDVPELRGDQPMPDAQTYGANTIKVRDLAHIQEFASEEFLSFRGRSGRQRTADDPSLKYEISGMPIMDIIEMVAGLLTKITTTNDRQHESLHRPVAPTGDSNNLSGLSSSVLAFHGKNVPSITILSYLSRIHKYCPTTYEVFLSLLVYFDRMTERVNAAPMQTLYRSAEDQDSRPSTSYSASGSDLTDSPPPGKRSVPEAASEPGQAENPHVERDADIVAFPLSHFFVVDSFNIHRLVIAGVTCASKFFSDVFYTNSRYAKVCDLILSIG